MNERLPARGMESKCVECGLKEVGSERLVRPEHGHPDPPPSTIINLQSRGSGGGRYVGQAQAIGVPAADGPELREC
jgi:hypothetical protein